ncbi:hypothetical protein DL96DRAFT_1622935 [Flagelloscypha sp. PMI_526]|nr:hypothetical protein DL96DRAFT_1622935 [Flagelloscypha sp. PMI_526]
MLWRAPLVALGLAVALGRAQQLPLLSTSHDSEWSLYDKPSENSTHNLVFDTIHSLLQHWPNTRYRNGHNMVPGTVAPGTLFYHGRSDDQLPPGAQWIATDPEHSLMFCRSRFGEGGCWHLTLVTHRELNVLYFDGSSAAKMPYGTMDTQDIVGWGNVYPERSFRERERIEALCDWGKPLGIDGFVRMEMDFEIMLCDFTPTGGVDVLSFLNLHRESGGPRLHTWGDSDAYGVLHSPPPPDPPQHCPPPASSSLDVTHEFQSLTADPITTQRIDSVTLAGHWHNHYPGETRVKLDLTRLVSFYDTDLAPSLVKVRYGVERWFHRLENITEPDVRAAMSRLENASGPNRDPGSGVDWQTLFHVIVDRFANRLEYLEYTLFNLTEANTTTILNQAQEQVRRMLLPYMLESVQRPENSEDGSWAMPIFKLCATSHTKFITSSTLSSKLTTSEHLLLNSINGVNKEICRTVTKMWTQFTPSTDLAGPVLEQWRAETKRLMRWLDWSVWVKCHPACSFDEVCYLPTWPFFGGGGGPRRRGPGGPGGPGGPPQRNPPHEPGREGPPPEGTPPFTASMLEDDDNYEWLRPSPRCVSRI